MKGACYEKTAVKDLAARIHYAARGSACMFFFRLKHPACRSFTATLTPPIGPNGCPGLRKQQYSTVLKYNGIKAE